MANRLAAEATRIAAGDDRRRYDPVEIALHWATAVFVVGLWLIAQAWGFLPRGSGGRHTLQELHVSFGILFAVILAARILWRLGPGRRPLPATTGLIEIASKVVHYALYAMLVAQVVLGFLWRWAQHAAFTLFGLFAVPSPFEIPKTQAHFFGDLHATLATIILIVAGLHAAAALFHHYVLHDDVLWRMLPGRRARRAEATAPDPRRVET